MEDAGICCDGGVYTCDECDGEIHNSDTMLTVSDTEHYCEPCSVKCTNCEELINRGEELKSPSGEFMCEDCFYVRHCEDCGRLKDDDGEPSCTFCSEKEGELYD